MQYSWQLKAFDSLSPRELYSILQLRINVFMLEQDCLYPECDNKDLAAEHIYAMNEDQEVIAYARLIPPGISYPEISIGRVVVSPDYRLLKLGKELMKNAIDHFESKYPKQSIRISAQSYLQKFYEGFDFVKVSDEYLEDNIPHVEMLRNSKANR